jgi:DNA gyrase subunit A
MDNNNNNNHKVLPVYIEKEIKSSYIDYAMSVIVARALPDVRDGLKPVQRRILYAMLEIGVTPGKPYRKSARVVGDVLGKYHPHGDTAVYDAMVRMAQEFSLRYPLVDGHGNFGSLDGDSAAAMRYTEVRMDKLAMEMLADLEKDTVDFRPNFDESLKEPIVLPAKLPNLIINGVQGIAVGMATNIAPHNLSEVCNAIIHMLENNPEETTTEDLLQYIKGPDFPTGASIIYNSSIKNVYETGRGSVMVRAHIDIEEGKKKDRVVIKDIPYQLNKSTLIEKIVDLVKNKALEGISDLRDESNREGVRIVLETKKGENLDIIVNRLYKLTPLQSNFSFNMVALVDNVPRVLNLKSILMNFISHRREVIVRRTRFELNKAEKRAHIVEGLLKALDNIDEIIRLIKSSANASEAREKLMQRFEFSEVQAQAILDMKLQKLTGLERGKLEDEYKELMETINRLKEILASPKLVDTMITDDLREIEKKYGGERKTELIRSELSELSLNDEDLIKDEPMVITMTKSGYIKRQSLDIYRTQNRGGKGVTGGKMKEEDVIEDLFVSNTKDYLFFISNLGKLRALKVYQINEGARTNKGKSIVNYLDLAKDEKIATLIPIKEFSENHYLLMITKKGKIKKTPLNDFIHLRKNGVAAIKLLDGDELVSVNLTNGEHDVIVVTRKGMAIRFNEKDVRSMGRVAAGVRAITLKPDDFVVNVAIVKDDSASLLVSTENGYGKRTKISEYRVQRRGGMGVKTIKITPRTGNVVNINQVTPEEELLLITSSGMVIRCKAKDIRVIGRTTQGVRLIRLKENDKLVAVENIKPDIE